MQKSYLVKKINSDHADISDKLFWQDIEEIIIDEYLWMQNNYKPRVVVKSCYSTKYIYLNFLVNEDKVTIRFLNCGDPVFKDSCVEFFLNLFHKEREEYFNIELNAIGTIKMGFGILRKRSYLTKDELVEMKIITTIKKPVIGHHGYDTWQLFCAVPINLFEKYYQKRFKGEDAIGNFYKCGDETEFKHYGVWNHIDNFTPNFHLPQFFGQIYFDDKM
jgi:hypothetical protein